MSNDFNRFYFIGYKHCRNAWDSAAELCEQTYGSEAAKGYKAGYAKRYEEEQKAKEGDNSEQ